MGTKPHILMINKVNKFFNSCECLVDSFLCYNQHLREASTNAMRWSLVPFDEISNGGEKCQKLHFLNCIGWALADNTNIEENGKCDEIVFRGVNTNLFSGHKHRRHKNDRRYSNWSLRCSFLCKCWCLCQWMLRHWEWWMWKINWMVLFRWVWWMSGWSLLHRWGLSLAWLPHW